MAVLPIDLQALFATSINAGLEQAGLRDGPAAAQAAQGAAIARQTQELDETVNDARDVGDGPERTDEDGTGADARRRRARNAALRAEADGSEAQRAVFDDPDLGQHVDVVG